jgi:aminopeptidase N
VQQYTLALALDPLAETLSGTVTIEAIATLDDLGRLSLDFSGDYAISALTVDGQPAAYQWAADKLVVTLPQALRQGAAFALAVSYHGQPQPIRSRYVPFALLGLTFKDGAAYVISEPDGARTWFPANDHPRDKARFRFEITVPAPYVVAANGQPQPPHDHGDGRLTYVWDSDMLMAPYLATVAVDQYTVIEQSAPNGLPIRHFAPPEIADEVGDLFAITGDMIVFLEEYFGPYPFESYGHVFVPVRGLALETQTMVVFHAGPFSAYTERLILHELAHQWFGDSVSPASWADVWLNEGFATYAEWLWLEARSPQALDGELERSENDAPFADPGDPLADPAPERLFGFNSYTKGAWVLHMLRHQIGDEAFFQLLPTYHRRFQDSVASSADLQKVAEEVSGQDLEGFFEQWVYGRGVPRLTLYWRQVDEDVEVRVCQAQAEPFSLPLILALENDAQGRAVVVEVQGKETFARFAMPFAVSDLIPDPEQHVLAQVKVEARHRLPGCP